MSIADVETANVEPITRGSSRFGLNPLQQFARAGLDLKIGDFRLACEQISERLVAASSRLDITANDLADILFDWMTETLFQDAGK